MHCSKCSSKVLQDDVFCSKCGNRLNMESNQINITSSGNNSPNIGNGMKNKVRIDNFYNNSTESVKKLAKYNREVSDFEFNKSKIVIAKFISLFVGVIGFIASIMTIFDFKSSSVDLFIPLILTISMLSFFISMFLFVLSTKMNDEEFAWIKLYWWMPSIILELTDDKKSYRFIKKIVGNCPKCGNELRVSKNPDTGKITATCRYDKSHRFRYEHSTNTGAEIELD